jgi:hypothetical protein
MRFLSNCFKKKSDDFEITYPTPKDVSIKPCFLSEQRIRKQLNLFNNSIQVYIVTCTNIYDTVTCFDDLVNFECAFWDKSDADEMVSQIRINDPSVCDGGKSDLYFQVLPIEVGIKISGILYILTNLKSKHKLITLEKILFSLENDIKVNEYSIFKVD